MRIIDYQKVMLINASLIICIILLLLRLKHEFLVVLMTQKLARAFGREI